MECLSFSSGFLKDLTYFEAYGIDISCGEVGIEICVAFQLFHFFKESPYFDGRKMMRPLGIL